MRTSLIALSTALVALLAVASAGFAETATQKNQAPATTAATMNDAVSQRAAQAEQRDRRFDRSCFRDLDSENEPIGELRKECL
jgi:hypothetical protein